MCKRPITWIIALEVVVLCVAGAFLIGRSVLRARGPGTPRSPAPLVNSGRPLPTLSAPRVLVEKRARRLTVCDGERPVKSYRIALGFGCGDKIREGDGCTPEGDFTVCGKNPRSKFTLSLGLSYPNIEDAARGLRDGLIDRRQHDAIADAIHRRTQPPWDTPLGGEIMIHGGGTRRDWTAGCIALSDEDIRELYQHLPTGATVTIVP